MPRLVRRRAAPLGSGTMRVDRLLSNLGVCSRRQVKAFLEKNRFTHRDKRVKGISELVSPHESLINGEKIAFPDKLYIAVHKPLDYVCSLAREAANNKIIYDLLPETFSKRIPTLAVAGRLDKFASGLVIMSQDGQFVNRILSPNGHAERVYEIEVEKPLRGDEPEHFASGLVELRGERTPLRPARMEITDPNHCRLHLAEGRYHQIRRMMATISNSTRSIHRVAVGPIKLSDLPVGKWRVLTPEEIDAVISKISVEERVAAEASQQRKIEKKRGQRKASRSERGDRFGRFMDRLEAKYIKDLKSAAGEDDVGDAKDAKSGVKDGDADALDDVPEVDAAPARPGKKPRKLPRRKYTAL